MTSPYPRLLQYAIEAARAAGRLLRAELHRPGGPRGDRDKAPADLAAEDAIREALLPHTPQFGLRVEERLDVNRAPSAGERHYWLIDPNDGTSAFHDGFRGSTVSIALIRDDVPVLGVVYAFAAPDDEGDLLTWAEDSGSLRRNGVPVPISASPVALTADHTVLVSNQADRRPMAYAAVIEPARYIPVPGIAYRLARVAAGDAVCCMSLFTPSDYDIAGGHALLRGAGMVLVDERGRPPIYHPYRGTSMGLCFGGAPAVVNHFVAMDWTAMARYPRSAPETLDLVIPRRGGHEADTARLRRAHGAMLGLLAGDATGNGPTALEGQPGEAGERALMLARSMIAAGAWTSAASERAWVRWRGPATPPRHECQSTTILARVVPIGIAGHMLDDESVAGLAREESAHSGPRDARAAAAFAVQIARAVRGDTSPSAATRSTELRLPVSDDANAAICAGAAAGARFGAQHGRAALPTRAVERVLTCRPLAGAPGVVTPRPRACWPVDALVLAERLLDVGRHMAAELSG